MTDLETALRDVLITALNRIANINNGPDLASASWRCEEAAAIARGALADRAAADEAERRDYATAVARLIA